MNKKLLLFPIAAAILVLLLIIFLRITSPGTQILTPDKSCTVDSDCTVKRTTCEICDCGDAVNKNWTPKCHFNKYDVDHTLCEMCPAEGINYVAKCISGECKKIWNETSKE